VPNWAPFLVVSVFAWAFAFAGLILPSTIRKMMSIVRFALMISSAFWAMGGTIMGCATALSLPMWPGVGIALSQLILWAGLYVLLKRWALPRVGWRVKVFRRALDLSLVMQQEQEAQHIAAHTGMPITMARAIVSAEGPVVLVRILTQDPNRPDET
jgi:hypothetical protein